MLDRIPAGRRETFIVFLTRQYWKFLACVHAFHGASVLVFVHLRQRVVRPFDSVDSLHA